jgi:hypothetical protein
MNRKLTCDESEDLEKDLTINEIKKIIFSMKQYKSPGLDGIINEIYQIYWDTIKEVLFKVLLEIFDKFEMCDSQCRGMLTLLHKGGDRDNIRNWRPITLLNSDYKIISKLLANRMKPVLNKIIHTDQKGFVAGRNISENNRMIDNIIEFVDNEDEEGVIIFVDQQKAFDRMEWGIILFNTGFMRFAKSFDMIL